MRLIPLTEIEGLEDGEIIPSISGVVKVVFQRRSGTNDKGDWSFQDFVLTGDGTEVIIKATNLEALDDLKGQAVTIESNKSEKHGYTGVKKLVEEYKGKTQHKVKLTSSCKIKTETNGDKSAESEIPDPDWPDVEHEKKPGPKHRPILDERQRSIIRQHSQSMALEVLKLKQMLNELTIEDLTPAKLRQLADYFDSDVSQATIA